MLRSEKPFGHRIDPFVELHRARGRREFLRLRSSSPTEP
jgi:hypothetical protein